MRSIQLCTLIIGVLLIALPARSEDHPTFKSYWITASQCKGSVTKEYPDFTMFICDEGVTYYYFTKPNHPAYPGVIKRMMTVENGATYVSEEGHSFASDAAQPAFKAWLEQFQELDQQMKAYAQSHSQPTENPN